MRVDNERVAPVIRQALAQMLKAQQHRGILYFKSRLRHTDAFFEELGRREQEARKRLETLGAVIDPNRPFLPVVQLIALAKAWKRKHFVFSEVFFPLDAIVRFLENYSPLEDGYDFRYKF